ncbi:hypothetical protein CHLRE_12g510800v5 [Chlamydomonas reinhardtii]|uniref:Mg-protoporphyrin IX chelatase n=1 Tax=Chlamydomonas reinhardtii TaxID=3055 RepID=A8IKQ6_CHLRE|nr:uncharacterized protein CHLRE_12g510800v5 [Chlamydomonas reinhardtii]PNW74766.1 hypothetical protein CHLRE_12g510800v5 [Chlamydomonas reinhardtii]|eukprot:XP_001690873.1 magnesium chelatase subunit I [Chlamydomonas reinhardtii]
MQSLQGQRAFTAVRQGRAGPLRTRLVVRSSVALPSTKAAKKPNFPFVKIQGQEEMKLALLLNVVDPNIGGVLIMGDRGTAKSVAVRALVDMLPDIDVVEGDAFNSSPTDPKFMGPDTLQRFRNGEKLPTVRMRTPLVELPLGATEDRICGTIDIEKALTQGIKAYEPGLLAKANRGILYVDEVNLLDDGLVDVVLDSSASGLNTVEREGVSIVHPARFIMIGSGNPQEGELRPQLLDRFGMSVNVATLQDTKQRTQLVLDRLAYEADPDAFVDSCKAEQTALTDKLEAARQRLRSVKISEELQILISDICSRLDVDGLRGDIVINRAAKALVAFEGRTEVTTNDVERVISGCLNHRLRKDPLDPIDNGTKVAILFKRMTDPEIMKREEEAKKKREEAAAKAKAEGKADRPTGAKAGAWAGLPPRR